MDSKPEYAIGNRGGSKNASPINLKGSYGGCSDPTCGGGDDDHDSYNPFTLPPGVPTPSNVPRRPRPNGAGGSGGKDGHDVVRMAAFTSGNGICRCIHVKELIEKVAKLEEAVESWCKPVFGPGKGRDPWQDGYDGSGADPH